MIAVKFHVALDETVSADDYMDVTVGDKNYQIKVSETTTATSSVTGEECNVFECKVNSKEMSKLISVKMVVDGKEGTPVEYSVKKYANTILENAQGTYT